MTDHSLLVRIRRFFHLPENEDHELDCKFPGVGEIMVTAKFVKKA